MPEPIDALRPSRRTWSRPCEEAHPLAVKIFNLKAMGGGARSGQITGRDVWNRLR